MLIAEFINDMFKFSPEETNVRGNMIKRSAFSTERYIVDYAEDFCDGWRQFDTDQDASYFGVWVNPERLQSLTYAEGDWTLVICADKEHYNAEIKDKIEFYGTKPELKVIDAEGVSTHFYQDRETFLIK